MPVFRFFRVRAAVVCTLLTVLWLVALLPFHGARAASNAIVAVVNEEVITQKDLENRVQLAIRTSNFPDMPDIRTRLTPQVLNGLIEETIKNQEAKRLGFTVAPEELETAIGNIAQQNNLSPEQFQTVLGQRGVNMNELREQVRGQLNWNRIVSEKLRPQVQVNDADIDNERAMLEKQIGQTEYRVAEILLTPDSDNTAKDPMGFARNLVDQARKQPTAFSGMAQQFSRAAGAAQGGDVGWIRAGQWPDEFITVIAALSDGGVSDPIATPTGIHIFQLRGKRTLTADTMPDRDQIINRIGLERLERLQRSYYLDLRASAFVDIRLDG